MNWVPFPWSTTPEGKAAARSLVGRKLRLLTPSNPNGTMEVNPNRVTIAVDEDNVILSFNVEGNDSPIS